MRPTGKLHLGHYFGVIKNWVRLQEEHQTLYMIADWHALTTGYKRTQEIPQNIEEMLIDWIALGIDPQKSILFKQSDIKEHAELFLIFSMITPKSWLEWNPTYKDTKYNLLRIADLSLMFKGGIRDLVKTFVAFLPYKVEDFEAFEDMLLDNLSDALIHALFAELMGYKPEPHMAVKALEDFLEKVGLRLSLKELGVEREKIERLTEDTYMLSRGLFPINPVEPTMEDIYKLYERAYEGY